jgi:FkbM family methyltransferase
MLLHRHDFLKEQLKSNIHFSLFDFIFKIILKESSKKIQNIADCGAGVGCTAKNICDTIRSYTDDFVIHCYEPFGPNFQILKNNLKSDKFILHQKAVSDKNKISKFKVPNFVEKSFGSWSVGSSYSGSLLRDSIERESPEDLEVCSVRLDNENFSFDFVKLDLQGGEHEAILGLGDKLKDVSLLYVEHDFLQNSNSKVIKILENDFTLLFDSIQFGFNENKDFVNFFEFENIGINIYSMWTNPLFYKAIIDIKCIDHAEKTIKNEVKELLNKYNVYYFQTDIIAINNKIASSIKLF